MFEERPVSPPNYQEEGLVQARDELKKTMQQAARHLEDGSFFNLAEMGIVINNFQIGLGRKIDQNQHLCADFKGVDQGYGQAKGVTIAGIDPEEFWRAEFRFFPKSELGQSGKLPKAENLGIVMMSRVLEVRGQESSIFSSYHLDKFIIAVDYRDDSPRNLQERNSVESAIAISELLLAVDRVVDQKLQTPIAPTP